MSDVREQLLELGWRQGSIIEAGAIKDESLAAVKVADAFLILNQTCDLVNPSFVNEPVVELLPLVRIENSDASLINGRNPRKIHFSIRVDGAARQIEAFAPGIVTIGRELLLQSPPSTRWLVNPLDLKSLLAWRAARYLRTAFPDAFEKRITPLIKRFKKLVDSIHEHLESIRIRVKLAELDEGEPYELDLLLVIQRKSHDIKATRDNLLVSGKKLEELINSSDELICTSCKVRARHEINLEEIDGYLRWERYDYHSFGEDD